MEEIHICPITMRTVVIDKGRFELYPVGESRVTGTVEQQDAAFVDIGGSEGSGGLQLPLFG